MEALRETENQAERARKPPWEREMSMLFPEFARAREALEKLESGRQNTKGAE
jgi:hypothetical protein